MTKKKLRGTYRPDEYNIDYDPLEHLLLGIIDAVGDTGTERNRRLKTAYEALTGVRIDRVDEPDGVKARAVAEYFRLEEVNFKNQDLPEVGGPTDEELEANEDLQEKTSNRLAELAAEKFSDTDEFPNLQEYVYKRVSGSYNNQRIQKNPLGYNAALAEQHYFYDGNAQMELHDDLASVGETLSKYNINIDLDRSFWRLKT